MLRDQTFPAEEEARQLKVPSLDSDHYEGGVGVEAAPDMPTEKAVFRREWENRLAELEAAYKAQMATQNKEQPPSTRDSSEAEPDKVRRMSMASIRQSATDSLRKLQEEAQVESFIITEPLEHGLVWLTQLGFTASTLVLAAFWLTADDSDKGSFVTTMLTCAIAAGAYYAKATGYGELPFQGRKVPIVRYLDWVATTPLMLYELCHLGGANSSTTLFILGCDLITLSFGIVSAFLDRKGSSRHMLMWFWAAAFFYVLMMLALHGQVGQGTALEQPEWVQELFFKLTVLTSVTWSCYPVVVFLGRAQCHVITKQMEELLLVFLDIVSKMGMEALIVISHVQGHSASAHASSAGSS